MKGLYWTGILLLYLYLVLGDGQQDCLVDDVYKKEHWSGEEFTFFTYVSDNDVVNIKITYKFLEETDYFTTFYFSPSKRYSRRIETKYGEEFHNFTLKTMEIRNEWVYFKISSEKGTIRVFYDPNTHEQISINQTSHTFKDLIIRASNISFCKDDKEWEVTAGNHQIIPLGNDMIYNSCILKINSTHDVRPYIKIINSTEYLASTEYELMIEKTKVILKDLKGEMEHIHINISQVVTSIEISSQLGNFTITVSCKTKYLSSTITPSDVIANEENCRDCHDLAYIVSLSLFVIFSIFICVVGLTSKLGILPFSSKLIKSLLKENQDNTSEQNSRAEQQPSRNKETNFTNNNRNSADEENDSHEQRPLKQNEHPMVDIKQNSNYEEVQHTAPEVSA